MKTTIIALISCLTLSGCYGKMVYDQMQNMDDMQASKLAYKKCLADNNGDKNQCKAEKSAFDADVEAFKGRNYTVNTNSGN